MKNKLLMIMVIIISCITLVGATAFIILTKFTNNDNKKEEPSIEKIVESTVEIPEITTQLMSNDYIRISFNIQTDSKKAKEELEKRNFQVKNLIIKELANMKSEEFTGEQGITNLENRLKDRINEIMQDGTIVKVYATSFLPQ